MKNNKPIIKKIFTYLLIFSITILAFLWLFQVIFLNSFYRFQKTKEVEKNVKNIIKNYDGSNLEELLENTSYEQGMCIEAVSENENIYFANNFNMICRNNNQSKYKKIDYINSDVKVGSYKNLVNNTNRNDNITYGIRLDEDIYIFITVSLIPMDSTISILSTQLKIVTFIVLALSILIAYFISKKISSPIIKISEKSKELSKGKYNIDFVSSTDIKEIKDLELTLDKASKELNKTEELRRELLANVSHDLKTPLTMIKAYSEMTRDLNIEDKNKTINNLNIIIDETDRLNILVNDILELSKMQANTIELKYEKFNLVDVTKNIINKFKILEESEKYKFIFNHKIKEAIVNCDRKKLEQAIYNLVNNAINYTGSDNTVYIYIIEENKKYKIEIKDTGSGIKEEDLKYIWDKYYKTDKKHKRNAVGSGIGLSIVKNVFEMHKFEYGVETNNNGTTFYFYIPKESVIK